MLLEHTADCLISVHSETLIQLFYDSAAALTAQLTEKPSETEALSRTLHIEAATREECLLKWLREILLLFEQEGFVCCRYSIEDSLETSARDGGCAFTGICLGETFDEMRHGICKEVKAVTRHRFTLAKTGAFWKAEFLLDL